MKQLQKMGGVAAILHSAAYLVGIGLYVSALSPILDASPEQYVAMLPQYKDLMYFWILIAYLVAGFALVPVTLALYHRLKSAPPALLQSAAILGFIWAALIVGSGNLMMHSFNQLASLYAEDPTQAETVYLTLRIVENGIVSANEVTGGLWVLLFSLAALKTGELSKSLNYFGVFIGAAGILTLLLPIVEMTTMIFGLSMIVWFAWTGIVLLRTGPGGE